MRLAIVNHHGGTAAGAEVTVRLLAEHLPPDIQPAFFLFEEGAFTRELRERGHRVTVTPMPRSVAATTRSSFRPDAMRESLGLVVRLARALRAAKSDVVVTNSNKAHVIGSLAARIAGLPCVNFIHDMPEGRARFFLRLMSARFGRSRLACSETTANYLGLPDTTVIYGPLELERYRRLPAREMARARLGVPNDDRPLVALVGRISPVKGQDRFIRIAARVRRQLDARFAIVGAPLFGVPAGYVDELKAHVRSHRLQEQFHFIPWQDDPLDVYAALDLGCNCSTKEPLGRTTLEAMAAGRAVICFDDSGVAATFGPADGVRVIPFGREDLFANAVVEICATRKTIRDAGEQAASAVQRLDVRRVSIPFADAVRRAAGAA